MVNREKEKHFGLRVNGDILAKFRYVCSYEGRSANSQIIQLMLKFIADYEKEHGKSKVIQNHSQPEKRCIEKKKISIVDYPHNFYIGNHKLYT